MAEKSISLATVIAISTAIGTVICKSIGKLARQSQKAVKFKNMYQAQPIGAATVIVVSTDKDIAIGTAIGIGKRQSHISSQRTGKFKNT